MQLKKIFQPNNLFILKAQTKIILHVHKLLLKIILKINISVTNIIIQLKLYIISIFKLSNTEHIYRVYQKVRSILMEEKSKYSFSEFVPISKLRKHNKYLSSLDSTVILSLSSIVNCLCFVNCSVSPSLLAPTRSKGC